MAQKAGMTVAELGRLDEKAAEERRQKAVTHLMDNLQFEVMVRFKREPRSGEYMAERRCYRGGIDWATNLSGSVGGCLRTPTPRPKRPAKKAQNDPPK